MSICVGCTLDSAANPSLVLPINCVLVVYLSRGRNSRGYKSWLQQLHSERFDGDDIGCANTRRVIC